MHGDAEACTADACATDIEIHSDTLKHLLLSLLSCYGRDEAPRRAFGTSPAYNPLHLPVFSISRHPTRALAPLTHSSLGQYSTARFRTQTRAAVNGEQWITNRWQPILCYLGRKKEVKSAPSSLWRSLLCAARRSDYGSTAYCLSTWTTS
jgi:hypothetical protein